MSKKIIRLVGLSLTLIVSIICLLFIEKTTYDFKVIGEKDSYANEFASKNAIKFEEVYTSNKDNYKNEVEVLEYKLVDGYYEVTNYNGISEVLVIPNMYQNKKVVRIDSNFLEQNKTIKTIIIQSNIESLDEYILENYKIECYNNDYCKTLDNDKVLILDEFNYNYISYEMDYEFNIENDKVILEKYNGNSSNIVIPEKYNGREVTNINFNIDTLDFETIYIPKNINMINITNQFNFDIIIALVLNVIAVIIFIILISKINNKNLTEAFNNTKRLSLTIFSLIISLVLSIIFMSGSINLIFYLITFVILTIVEMLLFNVFSKVKEKIETFDNKVKNIDNYKNDLLLIINDKKSINNNLDQLEETIKYSDPVSTQEVKDLEQQIKSEIEAIDKYSSIETINNIINLIKKRNTIIKNSK